MTTAASSGLPFELQEGEEVILLARQHWLYLLGRLVRCLLFALVPVVIVSVVVGVLQGFTGTFGIVVLLIELAWIVFWSARAYFAWYAYENDLWIVTNQRIVDSNRPNWFNHTLASADLVDVQDIAVKRTGILQTMFNFGHVQCQTAGEQENFILSGIPNPQHVLHTIDVARDAARRPGQSALSR